MRLRGLTEVVVRRKKTLIGPQQRAKHNQRESRKEGQESPGFECLSGGDSWRCFPPALFVVVHTLCSVRFFKNAVNIVGKVVFQAG